MRAYYASKLSPNISETREGFLICKNVPVAGTWPQRYFRHELNLDGDPNEPVMVQRREEDVFAPETIASFEGKPVTDDHPPGDTVDSDNAHVVVRGVARDLRRGPGEDSDKLLADLIIYDRLLADEIRAGKREISCGYDSVIVEENGVFYQTEIRGNHVAVVDAGRAGSDVSIQDSKPEPPNAISFRRRNNTMKSKKPMTFQDRVAKLLKNVKDADPDEVAEIVAEMVDEDTQADQEPTVDNQPAATDSAQLAADSDISLGTVMEAVSALTDTVKHLTDEVTALKDNVPATDSDPVEALEQAILQELQDEEATSTESDVIVNPEQIDEDGHQADESTVEDSEQQTTDTDPTADSAEILEPDGGTEVIVTVDKKAVLNHVRQMKPIIAAVKDQAQRKKMTDSLTSLVRSSLHKAPSGKTGNYQRMVDSRAKALQRNATPKQTTLDQDAAASQKAYDQRNPHKRGAK